PRRSAGYAAGRGRSRAAGARPGSCARVRRGSLRGRLRRAPQIRREGLRLGDLLPGDLDREGGRLGLDGEELLTAGLLHRDGPDAHPGEEPDRPEEEPTDDRAAAGPAEGRPAAELRAVLDADLADLVEVGGAVLPGAGVAEDAAGERESAALALETASVGPRLGRRLLGPGRRCSDALSAVLGDRRVEFRGAGVEALQPRLSLLELVGLPGLDTIEHRVTSFSG